MIENLCIREGCVGLRLHRGLCGPHYDAWKRAGKDPATALPKAPPGLRPGHRFPPRASRPRAMSAYLDGCETVPELASRFGVTDRTIHRWVREAGVRRRSALAAYSSPRKASLEGRQS